MTTDPLTLRIKQAAESLLDNESLTAELDEAGARVLIDWGLARTEAIAEATKGLDDEAAQAFISPRLRAVRFLMRGVNQWVATQADMNEGDRFCALSDILEQAAKIYPEYRPPDNEQQRAFLEEPFPASHSQWIVKLRTLIEGSQN